MQQQTELPHDLWDVLSDRLTPERKEKMLRVASQRTNHIRLVIQDVHQPHNVSACLRTAEAFGILNVHVVEMDNKYKPSSVARGVAGWLNVHRHPDVKSCASSLKEQGFIIAAGMPAQESVVPLGDMPVDKPIALLFGNEHSGVSPDWQSWVDTYFTIPMSGIVESLNISVSAAICMHTLAEKARSSMPAESYFIDPQAQKQLLGQWLSRQITSWSGEYRHHKENGK